jgi:hypothetical protein
MAALLKFCPLWPLQMFPQSTAWLDFDAMTAHFPDLNLPGNNIQKLFCVNNDEDKCINKLEQVCRQ